MKNIKITYPVQSHTTSATCHNHNHLSQFYLLAYYKTTHKHLARNRREEMAASVMLSSVTLKPAGFTVEKMSARGLPSLTRTSFKIVASGVKKIKTDKPFGPFIKYNTPDSLPLYTRYRHVIAYSV